MSARWAAADLLAAPIAKVRDNRAIVAEAAGLAPPPVQAREPASTMAREHESTPSALACLEFTVPTRPRGWQRDTPLGYGRSVKTAAEAAYQRDIAKYARQAKAAAGATGLLRGGVRLAVIAHLAVPKSYAKAKRADCLAGRILPILKPDFDNIAKSVADALTGVLWVDDKQVVAGSCLKMWAEVGSLHVRVQAL